MIRWYFVIFTAILWPVVRIFYIHPDVEALVILREQRENAEKLKERAQVAGRTAGALGKRVRRAKKGQGKK